MDGTIIARDIIREAIRAGIIDKDAGDKVLSDALAAKSATSTEKDLIDSLLIRVSDVQEKEMEWLLSGYVPRCGITVLAGCGGSGKTTIWCDIAAAISSGRRAFFEPIPDDFAAERKPGKVLFFSGEDSTEYSLRRRLDRAGANLDNIRTVDIKDDNFNKIKFNTELFNGLVERFKPDVVICDPLQSFIPTDVNMSQRNEIRNCLQSLIGLSARNNTAFIIICHTNKREGKAGRDRISDSSDIWDAARSVLMCGTTSDGIRYLSHEKVNDAQPEQTALFTIDDGVINFKGYTEKKDIDFVRDNNTPLRAVKRQDAGEFIREFLKDGKKPVNELDEAAKAAGIKFDTLKKAKQNLKEEKVIHYKSEGFKEKKWYCELC